MVKTADLLFTTARKGSKISLELHCVCMCVQACVFLHLLTTSSGGARLAAPLRMELFL